MTEIANMDSFSQDKVSPESVEYMKSILDPDLKAWWVKAVSISLLYLTFYREIFLKFAKIKRRWVRDALYTNYKPLLLISEEIFMGEKNSMIKYHG